MNDLRLELFEDGSDLVLEGGDLKLANGLSEAVLVSLFSDARASADDIETEQLSEPRGWWGEDPPDRFGSKLWLLSRAKMTELTVLQARDYCVEALAWLRTLDIAEEVTVSVTPRNAENRADIEIQIRRGRATQWSRLWEAISAGSSAESMVGGSQLRIIFR